jgi:predicted small secreted protein
MPSAPKADTGKCRPSSNGVARIEEIAEFADRISAPGEIDMKSPKLRSFTLMALAASLSLQACNTVAGFGKDVSAGADTVTDSAEENKEY